MLSQKWLYREQEIESPPDKMYGFAYVITDDKGRIYIGKKAFTHRKKTKLSKKARAGTRKKIQIKNVDSGWQSYWGSCKPLLAYIAERGGTEGFKREIIKFCKTKQDLTFWETAFLFANEVLFRKDCWNSHILSRFFKGKINE